MAEQKFFYEVNPGGLSEYEYISAHQMSIDADMLCFYEYKDKVGYAVPQLQTVAVYASGHWVSVREINQELYDEAIADA